MFQKRCTSNDGWFVERRLQMLLSMAEFKVGLGSLKDIAIYIAFTV